MTQLCRSGHGAAPARRCGRGAEPGPAALPGAPAPYRHAVWFSFQTLNPELPALDMTLMEASPGMENVRVRFASLTGRGDTMLRPEFCLMQFEGRDRTDSTGGRCASI